jgi:hypothetical protein
VLVVVGVVLVVVGDVVVDVVVLVVVVTEGINVKILLTRVCRFTTWRVLVH